MIGNVGGARPAYHDRNSDPTISGYSGNGVAPHGATTRFNFTVATGKREMVEAVHIRIRRAAAAAPVGFAAIYCVYTPNGEAGQTVLYASTRNNAVEGGEAQNIGSFGVLNAGDAFACASQDASTGGTVDLSGFAKRTPFDA